MQAARKRGRVLAPSFKGLQPASDLASQIKSRVRKEDTRAELMLRRLLKQDRIKHETCARDLPGIPDVVIRHPKVAVFIDGDFWHGRRWSHRRARLAKGRNSVYWIKKIEYNRARDRMNTRALRAQGWRVVRFWETDVLRDSAACYIAVKTRIESARPRISRSSKR